MFEPKELVEIIVGNGVKKRKKCLVDGDSVILQPGGKGRGNIQVKAKFTEDCFLYWYQRLPYPPFNKVLRRKLILSDGATECWHIQKKGVEIPVYDKNASKRLMDARVIKSAGETTQKTEVPMWFVFLVLANLIITLFIAYSFVRRIGL